MSKTLKLFTSYKLSNFEYSLSIVLLIFDITLVVKNNQLDSNIVINYLLPLIISIAAAFFGLHVSNKYWQMFYNNRQELKLKNVYIQIFACKLLKIVAKVLLCTSIYSLLEVVYIPTHIIVLILIIIFMSALPIIFYKEKVQ